MIRYGVVIWKAPTDAQPTHARNGVFTMHHTIIILIAVGLCAIVYVLSRSPLALRILTCISTEPIADNQVKFMFGSSLIQDVWDKKIRLHLVHLFIEHYKAQGAPLNAPGVRVNVELQSRAAHPLGDEYTLQATVSLPTHPSNAEPITGVVEPPPYRIIILKP